MDSADKGLSALRCNIKEKGEFSYYYAHKNSNADLKDAKVFRGPGIVTGGEPILLHKDDDDVSNNKNRSDDLKGANIQINKYSWSDCKESIEVYIMKEDLSRMVPGESEIVVQDKPKLEVTSNSISLEVDVKSVSDASKTHKLILNIPNLSNSIDSEISRVKVSNKRITIICFKQDNDTKWFSLTKPV